MSENDLTQSETETAPEKRPHLVRRMYDWVLSWAESPNGTWALFGLSFAESSFFPIPPDPLLMALALGRRQRALWYAFVCSLGSVAGGLFGYLLGWLVWDSVQHLFYDWIPGFTPERMEMIQGKYDEYGFVWVFVAGFTPIPYKIFTLASGAVGMNVAAFLLASAVSRSARFFLFGGLIRAFGAPIRRFIDKWFDRLAILFVILLLGGFFAVKYAF